MILSFLIFLKSNEPHLIGAYARPFGNPLEIYPIAMIPLCISDNMDSFSEKRCFTQVKPYISNFSTDILWCKTQISDNHTNTLTYMINKNYSIVYSIGTRKVSSPIGENGTYIFSKYVFSVFQNQDKWELVSVQPSNPINISQKSIIFYYSFEKLKKMPRDTIPKGIGQFFIGSFVIIIILGLYIFEPINLISSASAIIASIPSYTFIIVVLCGSGTGVLFFVITIVFESYCFSSISKSYLLLYVIPAAVSSCTTSIVTSLLCSQWRLKDVASAHYFAPLLIPILTMTIAFSVQWIPVCIGSCLSIPINDLFYFVSSTIFVKLPVNLIVSVIINKVYKPQPFHFLYSISVRKFPGSRKLFLCFANCVIFLLVFPALSHLENRLLDGITQIEIKSTLMFIPLWASACIIFGIASLSHGNSEDWALFSFLSSAGAGVVIWLVLFLRVFFFMKVTSTLQLSMHTAITMIFCVGLSLSGGALSVLSACIWYKTKGNPTKKN